MTYSLRGANGDTITFGQNGYILNPGLMGFGVPPTTVRIDDSVRPGGVWRNSRRGVRQVDLPITVTGTNAVDVETKLRRLTRLTQDTSGPTRLTTVRTGGNLSLELHYVGGAELFFGGDDGGQQFARMVLSFQAPQPFWESTTTQTFTIQSGNTGRGLLPQLTKLKLTSSLALGTIEVNNTGDVPVYPIYSIRGPIENFEVSNGSQSFGFNAPVDDGETITVDTEAGTVVDDGNVNRYDLFDTSPKLFPFLPGRTVVTVNGTDTTNDTMINVSYALRYEVVHG